MSRSPSQVIYGPVISERSYALSEQGHYTFKVAPHASKPEIAQALESHYEAQEIKVAAVNTINVRGKAKRLGQRGVPGRTPKWKKAIVTLAPGQKLEGLFGSL
jgi:large subunit ribosomal protein L23